MDQEEDAGSDQEGRSGQEQLEEALVGSYHAISRVYGWTDEVISNLSIRRYRQIIKRIGEGEQHRYKEAMTQAAFIGWQNYLVNWENPKKTPKGFHKWLETFGLADAPTIKVKQTELDDERRRAMLLLDRVMKSPGFHEVPLT